MPLLSYENRKWIDFNGVLKYLECNYRIMLQIRESYLEQNLF